VTQKRNIACIDDRGLPVSLARKLSSAVKKPKQQKQGKSPDDLPLKPVLDELAFVRNAFQKVVAQYAAAIEGQMSMVRETVAGTASRKKVSSECAHALRQMLVLLRGLEVKPEKGRRRDLKKIESVVEELRKLTDAWE
jgi:hypothetical protein